MFIEALFTIVNTKTIQGSIDGWMDKKNVTHTHTQEYYTTIKKNEILLFGTTWIDLKGIMLSEINQTKTNTVWSYL